MIFAVGNDPNESVKMPDKNQPMASTDEYSRFASDRERKELPLVRMRTRRLWILGTVLLLLVVVYANVKKRVALNSGEGHVAVGKRLSRIKLTPLKEDGCSIYLENLAGRVALINFWGTWCYPCRVEFPSMVAIQREFSTQAGFQFVSVSCKQEDVMSNATLRATTTQFLDSLHVSFPVFADLEQITRSAVAEASEENGFSYPTTLILDRDGVIRGVWQGYREGIDEEMRRTISSLLD